MRLLTDSEFAEEFDIAVEELTDQYVAGEIQGDERERVEQYFLKSADRRHKLKSALALNAYKSQLPARKKNWWTSTELRIAASILLTAGVSFVIWSTFFRQNDVNKGVLALQDAYRDQRPVEARISGWKYAPAITLRGTPKVDYLQRDRAVSLLQTAAHERADAASLHALGQSYLAQREFDKAIDQFEAALKLSNDAKIHSDLGAALLEKGKGALPDVNQGKGVEYFARGLTHVTRAIELDHSLLEPLFNRALIHSYLGLPHKAEQDWRQYLERDPNSQWSEEAREHLKAVEEQLKKTSQTPSQIFDEFVRRIDSGERESAWKIVRESQHRSGNVVVEQLLDNYLEREIANELQRLAYVADMDLEKTGDRFYVDVLNFYRSASPQQRELSRQGRKLMKQSHAGWGQLDGVENAALFREARKLFEQAGDFAEATVAEYWVSFSHSSRLLAHAEGLKILEPVISTCETNKYLWLKVRCLYLLSSIEFGLNRHSRAASSAREAVKLAESTSDSVGLLNASSALIEYYRYLGNYPKSLAQIQRALSIVNSVSLDPVQSTRHYGFGATAFAAIGFYDAGAAYQEEAMRLAHSAGLTARMPYLHAFLGTINGKRRHFDAALSNVNAAIEIATSSSQKNLMAYSALHRGHIYREMGDCDKAVDSYTLSIGLYQQLKFDTHIYQAHKGRLLCYIAQNDDGRAQQEIATTLSLVEQYRHQISEESNRNTFFEIEQSVYDVVIDFEASRMNDPDRAFQHLQYSRGRSLLDLLSTDAEAKVNAHDAENVFSPSVAQPASAAAIKESLPERAQLLQYAVLENKIFIWVISRRDIALRESSVPRRQLNETIQRYLQLIAKPSADTQNEEQALAKELYSSLIQPVASLLDKQSVICIIPDKNLSYIPFAALIAPDSNKYLVEDYVLTTSQSPSVFLYCSKNAREKSKVKQERLLSVGNPHFDRAAYPQLGDLPNAKQEALQVASHYKDPLPLVESEATSTAVKNQIMKSDVVHLAVHSFLDGDLPLYSKLLLAKTDLPAYEIYQLKMPRTRLVVLSSCQTGVERYYEGEGMVSLARAFMGAKVPLVVASLWPVDSKATEKLMVGFHKERQQRSTAEALAKAQREMIHGPETRFRNPYYWAAFTLNGGYAEF